MTVTEAARHFADLVNRTYYQGETTVLLKSGEAVAVVTPVGGASVTGRDWLARWNDLPRLDGEDAERFATESEEARGGLEMPKSAWD